jgi:hypothetical protein
MAQLFERLSVRGVDDWPLSAAQRLKQPLPVPAQYARAF